MIFKKPVDPSGCARDPRAVRARASSFFTLNSFPSAVFDQSARCHSVRTVKLVALSRPTSATSSPRFAWCSSVTDSFMMVATTASHQRRGLAGPRRQAARRLRSRPAGAAQGARGFRERAPVVTTSSSSQTRAAASARRGAECAGDVGARVGEREPRLAARVAPRASTRARSCTRAPRRAHAPAGRRGCRRAAPRARGAAAARPARAAAPRCGPRARSRGASARPRGRGRGRRRSARGT